MSGVLRRLWQVAAAPPARAGRSGRVRWPDASGAFVEAPHSQFLAMGRLVARDLEEIRLNGKAKPKSAADLGRVALLDVGEHSYITGMLGTWLAGSALVPLAKQHPPEEWKYFLEDSDPYAALVHPSLYSKLAPVTEKLGIPTVPLPDAMPTQPLATGTELPHVLQDASLEDEPALMLYTSGTTGRPKGVVHTHRGLNSQVECLLQPWGWNRDDHILNCLPLHHTHGLVNALLCPLAANATCSLLPGFDAEKVWELLVAEDGPTLFMAVPTVYAKLIQYYDNCDADVQQDMSRGCHRLRLMVSGSMSLPVPVMERWEEISGHRLLERYGMTEIGMALGNPLEGPRIPGRVGQPFPGAEVRIVDTETGNEVMKMGVAGELRVKGPNVFKEYWRRPAATAKEFDSEGWFKTGDIAQRERVADLVEGMEGDERLSFKILGRASVDILKVGGYKISSLDIERVLLGHQDIASVAVVGIPDEAYGQVIGAVVALKQRGGTLSLEELQAWLKKQLAPYKIPRRLVLVDEMPLNAMGKVSKKGLLPLFEKTSTA